MTVEQQINSTMRKAYWDLLSENITPGKIDKEWLIRLHLELQQRLIRWVRPGRTKNEIEECLDNEIFKQLITNDLFDKEELINLIDFCFSKVGKLQAPGRDDDLKISRDKVEKEIYSPEATFSSVLVLFLKEIHGLLDVLDKDMNDFITGNTISNPSERSDKN